MNEAELRRELESCHEAAFGWAMHCCDRNRDDALDVLQTAYLKALDGRARFRGESSFRTWLFTLVRHAAADRRRSWWTRIFAAKGEAEEGAGWEPAVFADERDRRIASALAELPGRQREALHLVFYQEMTVAEAAGVMGVSVGSARTHYERGKAKLREQLKDLRTVMR